MTLTTSLLNEKYQTIKEGLALRHPALVLSALGYDPGEEEYQLPIGELLQDIALYEISPFKQYFNQERPELIQHGGCVEGVHMGNTVLTYHPVAAGSVDREILTLKAICLEGTEIGATYLNLN